MVPAFIPDGPQNAMRDSAAETAGHNPALVDAAVSGVRWIAAARVLSDVVQLGAAVALARMIAPAEFGHAAIALILVPLATILTFEAFGSALVQRRSIGRAHLEAATLASLVAGAVLTVVVGLAAPLVAPVFGAETADLMRLASPLFAIAGASAVSRALLLRGLRFRAVSLVEMYSLLAGSAAAVVLALAGYDAEAIVLGAVSGAVVGTLLFVLVARPARPRWHRRELREILGFGAPASGAGLLHVATTSVDYTIVAARLGAAQTGFYWRAFQLGVVYQDKISGIMMRLAFPVYSRTSDLDELRRLHERATRVHAAVVVPLLAAFIVVAPELVPWLFGPRWEPSVLPAQILAVAGMIAAILTGFAQVMLGTGHPRELMQFNIGVLLVYGAAVWFAAPHGIVAVSVAVVGVYVLQLVAVYAVLFTRVVGIPVRRMITDLAPALLGGLALLAVGFPLAGVLVSAGVPVPVLIAVVAVVGFAAYSTVLRVLFTPVWDDLWRLVRRVVMLDRLSRARRSESKPTAVESSPATVRVAP